AVAFGTGLFATPAFTGRAGVTPVFVGRSGGSPGLAGRAGGASACAAAARAAASAEAAAAAFFAAAAAGVDAARSVVGCTFFAATRGSGTGSRRISAVDSAGASDFTVSVGGRFNGGTIR
ncbi:hypothetical protein, partial [Austwickia chelonae]